MWKRVALSLSICSLLVLLGLVGNFGLAEGPAAAEERKDDLAPVPAAGIRAAGSRITAVTVYPNSALVTRDVDVPGGPGRLELVVGSLPPQTINSSLYTEAGEGIRVLTTRFRTRQLLEDTREDVRKLEDELKTLQMNKERLDSEITAAQENLKLVAKMENFTSVTTTSATEKGALNSESAIALTKFIMERRVEKRKELVGLQQQVQLNQEKEEFAKRKLAELTSGSSRTEQDAVIVVEKVNPAAGKVRLHYLVDAASWRPQYKLRAGKTANDPVQLEYMAAVIQQTGESWDNVSLILSTAQPALHAAPPDLQVLQVTVLPRGSTPLLPGFGPDLQEQARTLRTQAAKDFNDKKSVSAVKLCNTAAALDQSCELLNPNVTIRRDCAPGSREGPSVTYHLANRLSVPSRNDEQILEVARLEMTPDYYYKAVPVLTAHVYRLADMTNKSNHVLLPGEATMYVNTDFVGQMNLPLVAIGEQFTVGFGVDPQLQVQRVLMDRSRNVQGGNQVLKFEYRILVSSYKSEKVKLQVWDRVPFAENENVGVSLVKAVPETSKDALYLREQRPNNLLRWDVVVEPTMNGEKALGINYDFKLELDRQMALGGFQSGNPRTEAAAASPVPMMAAMTAAATTGVVAPMTKAEEAKIQAAMAKLSPEDRRLAEAQVFCAIEEESRLGSVGPILKVMANNRPVFVCCKGCEKEAKANPQEALAKLDKIMARVKAGAR